MQATTTFTKRISTITLTLAVFCFICPCLVASNRAAASTIAAVPSESTSRPMGHVREAYGKLPLSFEANRGQADEMFDFLARGPGYLLALTPAEAVFALRNVDAPQCTSTVLRMNLVGANRKAAAAGMDELEGRINYFTGNDPARWRTNLPTFARVRYTEVYPGIDVVYYGNQKQLEYDFVVAPGSDARAIALEFSGAESVAVESPTGDLLVRIGEQTMRQHAPVTYQMTAAGRREVKSRYVMKKSGRVGFQVGEYDTAAPLIIDPVLEYSTFVGGSAFDSGTGITVDAQGNAYVTGSTNSANFPTLNPIQTGPAAAAFVTKINAAGTALVYSTYLGGNGSDGGGAIAVDADGNAYVTGNTSSTDFPTVNPVQSMNGGNGDVFVAKVNPVGNALVHSTYLGGSSGEGGRGIAVDSTGNVYVVGTTQSSGFPTANAFDGTFGGTSDGFMTKIAAAGGALVYSTFLGGTSTDQALGVAVDAQGNAYVTGTTTGNTFPTVNPIQGATNNGSAFVTKINAAGAALVYSTFLGGDGADSGTGIALDPQGNVCVTGVTTSSNFPLVNQVQSTRGGTQDAFVTKVNAAGSAYVYSTYLGGTGTESPGGMAVDASGNAYVIGITASSDFPLANPLDNSLGGANDLYLTKLNPAGAFVYSTYFGGSGIDQGFAIAADASGSAYLTGLTSSSTFPTTVGAYDTTINGGEDVFIVKISDIAALQLSSAVSRKTHGAAGTFDIDLPLTGTPGVECRSSAGNHTLVVEFTNDVVSGSASVTSGTGGVSGSPSFSANTMTVDLTGVADVQPISVTLTGVTDSFNQVLPNTVVSMNVLAGDTNGNKAVNASDVGQTKAQSGITVTTANFRQDVTPSGTINSSDIGLVKSRSGQSIP